MFKDLDSIGSWPSVGATTLTPHQRRVGTLKTVLGLVKVCLVLVALAFVTVIPWTIGLVYLLSYLRTGG